MNELSYGQFVKLADGRLATIAWITPDELHVDISPAAWSGERVVVNRGSVAVA